MHELPWRSVLHVKGGRVTYNLNAVVIEVQEVRW